MKLPNEKRSQNEAKQIARNIFDSQIQKDTEYINLNLDEGASKKFRWEAWAAIKGLWSLEDPTQVEVKATEKMLNTKLGGVSFLGFIDRVDDGPGGISILDYKSGKFPTYKKSKEEKLEQVYLYAAAYETMEGITPSEVKIYFTNPMESNKNIGTIVEKVTEDTTQSVVEDFIQTHSSIQSDTESKNFEAKPGPLCGWCFYVDKCEQGQSYVEERHQKGSLKATAPAIEILKLAS